MLFFALDAEPWCSDFVGSSVCDRAFWALTCPVSCDTCPDEGEQRYILHAVMPARVLRKTSNIWKKTSEDFFSKFPINLAISQKEL